MNIKPYIALDIETTGNDVNKAKSPEEMRDASRILNETVNEDFAQVKARAKSPVSIEFAKLTERQNQVSKSSEPLVDRMIIIMRQLEEMNLEDDDRIELRKQIELSTELCQLAKKNNTNLTEILNILERKIKFSNNPTIIKEMFYGDPGVGIFILKLRDTQADILAREQQGYKSFQCEELLLQQSTLM
jgi:hypothetical protein